MSALAPASATRRPALFHALATSRWTALALAIGLAWFYLALRHMTGPGQLAPSREDLLVGQSLLATTGKMSIGRMIAAYPPVALAPMLALHALTGMGGAEAAATLAAALGGGLGGLWFRALLRAGYGVLAAAGLTALLALNPLYLAAIEQGPEVMLALAGVWLLAGGAYALRHQGGVNDLMLCSLALVLLVFSGPLGLLAALAALPFLPLAFPADIRPAGYSSVYLVILFPVVFCVLGFALVNWMMLHDAWAFLDGMPVLSHDPATGIWQRAGLEMLFTVACAPVLLGQIILARSRRPLQAVAFALLGMMIAVMALSRLAGTGLPPVGLLALAIPAAAAAVARWPRQPGRLGRVTLLLALGAAGSASVLFSEMTVIEDPGAAVTRQHIADSRLGAFLAGHDGVLIDGSAHPRVIAARGSARGLVTETDADYGLSLLTHRVHAQAVAVAAPDPAHTADTLGQIMPDLYASGQPGFSLVYDRDGWRVWARNSQQGTRQ